MKKKAEILDYFIAHKDASAIAYVVKIINIHKHDTYNAVALLSFIYKLF